MRIRLLRALLAPALWACANAWLNATEANTTIILSNDRLYVQLNKTVGAVDVLRLDDQDLLGTVTYKTSTGIGPYLDCHCLPNPDIPTDANKAYTPGGKGATYELFQGQDSDGILYGGAAMTEVYPGTGQLFQQYWFLRQGETGLHLFSRMAYTNDSVQNLGSFAEFRTLFRPNSSLWNTLSTNDDFYGPSPLPDPASTGAGISTVVQDATWDLSNRTNDPYVEQVSDYFTKYTFSDVYRSHDLGGLYCDGSTSDDGSTYGAWMIMNTKDTYYGGPTYSDLIVDGITYNYIISNHHGNQPPNITTGFDRTFGPSVMYFNKGTPGSSLADSRKDASQYANPWYAASFYDSIAPHVTGYVPSSGRGSWEGKVCLPQNAKNPIAILSAEGYDYQDNGHNISAYQYWADIDPASGCVSIDRVKAGNYRLTLYADGIFGDYVQDGIVINPGEKTTSDAITWNEESAGSEIWRIGYPDKSSGEYRHGYAPDPNHPLHPPEYRIYYAAYDFIDDFPNGVNFQVGQSSEATDLNYIHWSVFGGYGNSVRTEQVAGDGNINNWTISFDVNQDISSSSQATLTIQLAGAKGSTGNTDDFNSSQTYNNIDYAVSVNGNEVEPWVIP